MVEWVEVDDLTANVVGDATYSGPEGSGAVGSASLASTTLALTWENMYNHATKATAELAVSVDTTTNRTTQKTAEVTQADFAQVVKYGIFVFVSSNGNGPGVNWPMGIKNNVGQTDGTDDNGQWYLAKEVTAPHVAVGTLATISSNLEVPPNKEIAVWVGVRNVGMPGWSDLVIHEGLPGDQPN